MKKSSTQKNRRGTVNVLIACLSSGAQLFELRVRFLRYFEHTLGESMENIGGGEDGENVFWGNARVRDSCCKEDTFTERGERVNVQPAVTFTVTACR